MSTSRSWAASPPAAATASTAEPPPGARSVWATPTCTPPSTTTAAWPTPRSWPTRRAPPPPSFWRRAESWFRARGIVVERVLSDNGFCYRGKLFNEALAETPHHPQVLPALPAPDQRQGRALPPHPARGVGLRPALLPGVGPHPRTCTLAPPLQPSPGAHRHRRSAHQPRHQPPEGTQLERGVRENLDSPSRLNPIPSQLSPRVENGRDAHHEQHLLWQIGRVHALADECGGAGGDHRGAGPHRSR